MKLELNLYNVKTNSYPNCNSISQKIAEKSPEY